jgi:cell division protein FtsZ
MPINLKAPQLRELKPRIVVCGVGGAGGNAINNMIASGLSGVDFVVANTDAQALASSRAERIIQMGLQVTEGLGAGARPEVGKAAAEEALEEICDHLAGSHMVFLTAGMGGGTGQAQPQSSPERLVRWASSQSVSSPSRSISRAAAV